MADENLLQYNEIVNTELNIHNPFLECHKDNIWKRVENAYNSIENKDTEDCFSNRDVFGLNQCIHLATSVVLLGTAKSKLPKARTKIAGQYKNNDPSTILTIAMLFYLLENYLPIAELPEVKDGCKDKIIKDIRRRFDAVNWMVGTSVMKDLGITSL